MIHSSAPVAAAGSPGAGASTMPRVPPVEEVRAQLERILASSMFSRSERLSRFLRFIVDEKIAGRFGDLKEYTIGTQVYGRGVSFDPTTDTIVRVEARRLRATLRKYYAGDGRSDPTWVDVPKGGYKPVFRWKAFTHEEPKARLSSVAVLPFEAFGPDVDHDDFCDGVTDEVIHTLAQVEGLRVAARTSVFAFKRRYQDVRRIGEILNVGAVVEGSVRKDGQRLRITTQLINVDDGYHLWSRRFDREMTAAFAIQDEIARAVADGLRIRLGGT